MAPDKRPTYRLYEAQAYLDALKQKLNIKNESDLVRFSIFVTYSLVTASLDSTLRAKNILKSIPQVTVTERLQLGEDSSLGLNGKDTRSQIEHAQEFLDGEIVVMLERFKEILDGLEDTRSEHKNAEERVKEREHFRESAKAKAREKVEEEYYGELEELSDYEILLAAGYDKDMAGTLARIRENNKKETERLKQEAEQAEKEKEEAERNEQELKDKRRQSTAEKGVKKATEKTKNISDEKDFIEKNGEKELNALLKIIKKGYGYYLFEPSTQARESYIIPVRLELLGASGKKTDTLYSQYMYNKVRVTPVLSKVQEEKYKDYTIKHNFNFTTKGDVVRLKALIRKLVDATGTPIMRSGYIRDAAVKRKKYYLYKEVGISVGKDFKFASLSKYSPLPKTYKYDVVRTKDKYYKDMVINSLVDTLFNTVVSDKMTDNNNATLKDNIKKKMVYEIDFYARYKAKYSSAGKHLYKLLSYYR